MYATKPISQYVQPQEKGRISKTSVGFNSFVSGALVVLMVLYALVALVQGLLPFSLNRILGAIVIAVLGYDFISRLTGKRVIAICVIGLLFVFNVGIMTSDRPDELEFFIYWTASLLILIYIGSGGSVASLREATRRYGSFIRLSMLVATLFVAGLLVTHTGYHIEWGGGFYFTGFCNAEHTMASVCCLIMSLAYLSFKNKSVRSVTACFVLMVMTWALLQTGARTFLVPAAAIWIVFIRGVIGQRWLRILIFVCLGVFIVYIFASTGMATKFDYLSGIAGGNLSLSTISSGRVEYWATDLGAYLDGNPFTWLFGNSASFVYDLNQTTFNMRIWSHNDFVMLVCSVGVLGLVLYLIAMKAFFKKICGSPDRFTSVLLVLFVLFPAIFNGFYSYQHFVYSTVFFVCAAVPLKRVTVDEL